MNSSFVELLSVKKGHFLLESGMHGDVWFDLEPVFVHPHLLEPFIDGLATVLSHFDIDALCGAFVGGAFIAYPIARRMELNFFYTERAIRNENGVQTVSYRLPAALSSAVTNRKIAVIDDVINAGSAVTKTSDELRSFGGIPVVMASILTVGGHSPKRLSKAYPPVVSLEHLESMLWEPQGCPLCKSGVSLVDPYREDR
jgi:orotate phosphoribosyltransferase